MKDPKMEDVGESDGPFATTSDESLVDEAQGLTWKIAWRVGRILQHSEMKGG